MATAATLQGDLGPTVMSADGEMSTADVMVGKQYVGLYFSAHWCPPCRDFTPMLADWYTANAADLELELVFVSSDNDEEGFAEYFDEMPWKALPYSARAIQVKLSQKYTVSSIPALLIVDAKSGEVCTANGVEGVSRGSTGLASFPWKQPIELPCVPTSTPELKPEPAPDMEPEPDADSDDRSFEMGEEVQLLDDPVALRAAFARFFASEQDVGEDGGNWGTEVDKLAIEGIGVVVEVYEPDRSLTLQLVESAEVVECPFEAVARKTGNFDPGFDWARAKYSVGQTVQLVAELDAFREAFSRFDGDEDGNDWSPAKQEYLSAIAKVAGVYDDKTLTLKFNDGVQLDFPFESIDLDITVQLHFATAGVKEFQCKPCGPRNRVLV